MGHSRSTTLTLNRENGVETPSYYKATGSYPWQNPSINGILYFAMLTDKYGSNLNVRADYSYGQSNNNTTHDFDGEIIPDDNRSLSEVFRAKANYKLKRNSFSLDFGYQIYGIRLNDRRDYNFERDDFRNHDVLNSVFAQLDWTCSNTVSVSGGLRMEHTHNTIEQRSTSEHFTRNYVNWVPNASVSFTLPQGRFIAVNFSPFLVRPYYSQMNPYKKWSSENAYRVGNPNLKTYVSWDGNIYAQLFPGFTVNFNISISDDSYCMYTINDGEGNAVSSYANEGRDERYSLGFGYSKTLFGIWTLNAHMYGAYRNRKAIIDTQDLGFEDWSGSFSLSNNVLISRTYGLYGQVSYSIHTPTTLISEKNSWKSFLGCSISKTFDFGLDIDFTVFSPIGSMAKSYSNPEFSYHKRMRDSPVGFYLSLSYKFGKKTVKKTQNIGSSGDMRKG